MTWLSASGAGEYPDLNEEYLDRLERVLGAGKLREILSDGLLELADRLERLRRLATAAERRGELAAVAHDMIGAAGHLGLTRLSLAAAELERRARRPGPPLAAQVRALDALADAGFGALRARIAAGAGLGENTGGDDPL